MQIRLFITGRMYHAASAAPESLDLADEATVADAITQLQSLLPEPLPESTLVSVAGRHLGSLGERPAQALRDGDELLLVTPVAGG